MESAEVCKSCSMKQVFLAGLYISLAVLLYSFRNQSIFPREGRRQLGVTITEHPPRPEGIVRVDTVGGVLYWDLQVDLFQLGVYRRGLVNSAVSQNSSHQHHVRIHPINGTSVRLIHNAVPKTGSRALELLIRRFAYLNKDKIKCKLGFPQEIQDNSEEINQFVLQMERGSYVRGHFPYQPFTDSESNVKYINIVRSPIERLQSNYYYDLYGDDEHDPENKPEYHKPTIDECVKDDVCFSKVYSYYRGTTLKTFCGHDDRCSQNTRWTLERAKENSAEYLFIGVTSEWDDTVRVLETLLPDLFGGLSDLMTNEKEKGKVKFKTVKKIPLKNKTLEFLQRDMSLEEEFYQYVKESFERARKKLLQNAIPVGTDELSSL